MLTHIYGIQKGGTDEPTCRAVMETEALRTDLWTWLVGGGRGQWDVWREQHGNIHDRM